MARKSIEQILKELEGPMKSSAKTLKQAQGAMGKGTVRGNNVAPELQAKQAAAAKAEAARQQRLKSEDAALKGMGRGLKGRRGAIDKLSGGK